MESIAQFLFFLIFLADARSTNDFQPENGTRRVLIRHKRSPEVSTPSNSERDDKSPPTTPSGGELIRNFVEHFQNAEAATKPLPIPDPMFMPDRIYPILTWKVDTRNVSASGISRIRVRNFTLDAVKMKVHFMLRMPLLVLTGNYSYLDWLQSNFSGSFNITLVNALSDCNGKLEVTRDGELAATEIDMDTTSKEHMDVTFQNAGFVGFLVNTFGAMLFDSVEPYFLSIVSGNIRENINDHLKLLKIMFPNSIQPLDLAIAEGRKVVKNSGFDPYHLPDYLHTTSVFNIDFTNIVVTGLSSFHRVGEVEFSMENHVVTAIINVGTEEINGSCSWEAGIGSILTRTGSSSFTVNYVDVMISVNQSLDIRKRPKIVDLEIKVGNVQLRTDGAGILDYLAEMGMNILPNLLINQILQAVEKPIRRKLQEAMNDMDIERILTDKLPMFDQGLIKNHNVTVIEDNFDGGDTTTREKEVEQDTIY